MKGNYCFISNGLEDCDSCHMIVVGDETNDNYLVAFADSLGLIRYINFNEKILLSYMGKMNF